MNKTNEQSVLTVDERHQIAKAQYGTAATHAEDAIIRSTELAVLGKLAAVAGDKTDQEIYNEFDFLEGLVNEHTYRQIADKAIDIYKAGIFQSAASNVNALAQEIRRVDGNHSLGAGALAEALMPFLSRVRHIASVGMNAEAWAELHRLRAERGPADGSYATWKDAAVAERLRRVDLERASASAAPAIPNTLAVAGEAEPLEVMRELLELTVKAGRRCAYDLKHAAQSQRDDESRQMYRSRAEMWQIVFNPANGPKDYRNKLHAELEKQDLRIARLEQLCKENGIDCQEF